MKKIKKILVILLLCIMSISAGFLFGLPMRPAQAATVSIRTITPGMPLISNTVYLIENEDDLWYLADMVNATGAFYAGGVDFAAYNCSLFLVNDINIMRTETIDIEGVPTEVKKEWVPIGYDSAHSFRASGFDGNGKTIDYMTINNTGSPILGGFVGFSNIRYPNFKNLTIGPNSAISGKFSDVGAFIGRAGQYCSVINCVNKADIYITGASAGSYIGGLVGNNYDKLENNRNEGNIFVDIAPNIISSGTVYIGGISGYSNAINTDSVNEGKITVNGAAAGSVILGGITGKSESGYQNCINNGEILLNGNILNTNAQYTGGILGQTTNGGSYLRNCINNGNIKADNSGGYIGGIVGYLSASDITNCANYGTVQSFTAPIANYTAGIAARVASGTANNNYNAGAVTAQSNNPDINNYAAGIVSVFSSTVNIGNNYNIGGITLLNSGGEEVIVNTSTYIRASIVAQKAGGYVQFNYSLASLNLPIFGSLISNADSNGNATFDNTGILTPLGTANNTAIIMNAVTLVDALTEWLDYTGLGRNNIYKLWKTGDTEYPHPVFDVNWTQKWEISFAPNAAGEATSEVPPILYLRQGRELVIPAGITRNGYNFTYWRASTNGTNYQEGQIFTVPNSNVRFDAQWTANTITASIGGNINVTYNGTPQIISVTNKVPSDALTEYSLSSEGPWDANLTFTDAMAATTVYYRISKTNYVPLTGSRTITINKAGVIVPVSPSALPYNGLEQQALFASNPLYSVTDDKAVDAGTYSAKITLTDFKNYVWATGTASDPDRYVAWNITPSTVAAPVAPSPLVYNEQEQYCIIEESPLYGIYTESGTYKATAAGEYHAYVYLKNTTNCTWVGGSTGMLTITWTISKKTVQLPAPSTTLIYNGQIQSSGLTSNELYNLDGTISAVNAGNYTASVTLTDPNNYKWENSSATTRQISWNIGKAEYEIIFQSKIMYADGAPKFIYVSNNPLPDGISVTYFGNGKINAGTYTVTARFLVLPDSNYNPIADVTAALIIESQLVYDTSGITLTDSSTVYNGYQQHMTVSGLLPGGLSMTLFYKPTGAEDTQFSITAPVNAGSYTVKAVFTPANTEMYAPVADKFGTFIIKKATFDMAGITFNHKTFKYEQGVSRSISISGTLPEGITVSYIGNEVSEIGTHPVEAVFTYDTHNYNYVPSMFANIQIITAGTYDMSGVTFNDMTVTCDGKEHSIYISGFLPVGVTVSYTGNGKTETGKYTVTAHFNGDFENFLRIPDMAATLYISPSTLTHEILPITLNVLSGYIKFDAELQVRSQVVSSVSFDNTSGKEVLSIYDISLVSGSSIIQPNGFVRVTLTLSDDIKANYSDLAIAYIAPDGSMQIISSDYNGNAISFLTGHFSNYAIIGHPAAGGPTIPDDTTSFFDGFSTQFWILAVIILLFAIINFVILAVSKKRRKEEIK